MFRQGSAKGPFFGQGSGNTNDAGSSSSTNSAASGPRTTQEGSDALPSPFHLEGPMTALKAAVILGIVPHNSAGITSLLSSPGVASSSPTKILAPPLPPDMSLPPLTESSKGVYSVSQEDVKKYYRKCALAYHPDRHMTVDDIFDRAEGISRRDGGSSGPNVTNLLAHEMLSAMLINNGTATRIFQVISTAYEFLGMLGPTFTIYTFGSSGSSSTQPNTTKGSFSGARQSSASVHDHDHDHDNDNVGDNRSSGPNGQSNGYDKSAEEEEEKLRAQYAKMEREVEERLRAMKREAAESDRKMQRYDSTTMYYIFTSMVR